MPYLGQASWEEIWAMENEAWNYPADVGLPEGYSEPEVYAPEPSWWDIFGGGAQPDASLPSVPDVSAEMAAREDAALAAFEAQVEASNAEAEAEGDEPMTEAEMSALEAHIFAAAGVPAPGTETNLPSSGGALGALGSLLGGGGGGGTIGGGSGGGQQQTVKPPTTAATTATTGLSAYIVPITIGVGLILAMSFLGKK